MGFDLTESAIDEFYGMIRSIDGNLWRICKMLEVIAQSLDSIATTLKTTAALKKGGEA